MKTKRGKLTCTRFDFAARKEGTSTLMHTVYLKTKNGKSAKWTFSYKFSYWYP